VTEEIGRYLREFHSLSASFSLVFPDCKIERNLFHSELLPAIAQAESLPEPEPSTSANTGIIHGDFHGDNFMV
jgi:Ser/Thr protein kinase RdoA (MazF antagonist)